MRVTIRNEVRDMDVTTVAIVENFTNDFIMFNCPTCKNPVFQYKGKLVSIAPGYAPTEIPVVIQCNNTSCRQKYLIDKILSKTN